MPLDPFSCSALHLVHNSKADPRKAPARELLKHSPRSHEIYTSSLLDDKHSSKTIRWRHTQGQGYRPVCVDVSQVEQSMDFG